MMPPGPVFFPFACRPLLLAGLLLVIFGGALGVLPAPCDRVMPVYADGAPAYEQGGWLPAKGR